MTTRRATGVIGRGVLAGVAATGVMTAFQKLVEMPITGREDSYAPADFAQKVLPVNPTTPGGRRVLNYVAHFGIGTGWGVAVGVAERAGLRGQRAVATVFGVVYTGDVLMNTALGLYKPWRWSVQDWVIDVGEKLLQAEATMFAYERSTTDGR